MSVRLVLDYFDLFLLNRQLNFHSKLGSVNNLTWALCVNRLQ